MKNLVYLLVVCLSCAMALGSKKMEPDKLEKTKAFLLCQVPEDSKVLSFSNGYRSFEYDVKFSSSSFNIEKYAKTLENNRWEKITESGWKRKVDLEQIIYMKNKNKYIITKETENIWRELVITNEVR